MADPLHLGAADRNHAAAWEVLLASAPGFTRLEVSGALALATALPIPLFNPVFVTAPPADADALVAAIVAAYAEHGAPFALYARDEVAPAVAPACERAGLLEHFRPPLMTLAPIPDVPPPPADLHVDAVSPATVSSYAGVLAAAFGMPEELANSVFGPGLADADGFTGLLGTIDGQPVVAGGVYVTGELAGIYNIATHPDHTGRGLGTAITWASVAAGAEAGATWAVLQASGAGEPVYQRMGFATPARYRQFEPAG